MSSKQNTSNNRTSLSKIMETAGRFSVPTVHTTESAWEKLDLKKSKQVYLQRSWLSRAAAILIIAVALFSTFQLSKVNIITAKGEHKTVLLPDNSKVTLNAESFVSYNSLLWKLNRTVSFNGEGIFKVTKGSTFKVVTNNGSSVKVLGTSFDVLNRSNIFRVACMTGRVQVEANNSKVVLTHGQNTSNTSNGLTQPEPFNKNIIAWEKGEFYFSNTRLSQVAEELERQFNINVELLTDKERFYSGYFNNRDLDEALKLVCVPLGLSYEIESAKKVKIINYEINV